MSIYRGMCEICNEFAAVETSMSMISSNPIVHCLRCLLFLAEPEKNFIEAHRKYTLLRQEAPFWIKQCKTHVNGKYLTWDEWVAELVT